MARKGMLNVMSLQKPYIKPGIMPDFGPFLSVHFAPAPFPKQGQIAGQVFNLFPRWPYCIIV
jgi:hypothetical protein